MAKSCLGIDIGKDQLKLVLMKGENIVKTASVQMPEGLLKDGRIVSVETTGELIRKTMKENKIRCKEAAVVVSSGICFLRNVTMPEMTAEQLVYNLPYEFRDYITDELKKYVFDYSWGSGEEMPKGKKLKKASKKKKKEEKPEEEENQKRNEMELLAAAAPLEVMEELRLMTRKAGLKLTFAAPEVSACENLLHYKLRNEQDKDKEYGILDLGSTSSRLFIFKGDRHQVTRVIERGMEQVEELLADNFHIDIHLAHTWLLANHEDCIHSEVCQDAFSQISVELMRALNFYQFSNPDSRLEDIYICGGGASIATMRQSLEENLDVKIHEAGELLERMNGSGDETSSLWMLAAGTALGRTAHAPKKQINLALAGQKKKHYFVAIPAIGAIIVAAGVIGKVVVADRLVKMSEAQSAASELQKQVDELTQRLSDYQSGNPTDLDGVQAVYDNLIQAMQYYINDDKLSAAKALDKVDPDSLAGDEAKKFYKKIKKETYSTASESFFEQGRDCYNGQGDYAGQKDYDKAIKLLKKALKFNADNTDAMYFLGRCYQQKSDFETAKQYYDQVVNDYPDSVRVAEAKSRLREIGQ